MFEYVNVNQYYYYYYIVVVICVLFSIYWILMTGFLPGYMMIPCYSITLIIAVIFNKIVFWIFICTCVCMQSVSRYFMKFFVVMHVTDMTIDTIGIVVLFSELINLYCSRLIFCKFFLFFSCKIRTVFRYGCQLSGLPFYDLSMRMMSGRFARDCYCLRIIFYTGIVCIRHFANMLFGCI